MGKLELPAHAISYNCMRATWNRDSYVTINIANADISFFLPISFLTASQTNTLQYVQELAQILVAGTVELVDTDRSPLRFDDAPTAGAVYLFQRRARRE